MRRVVSLVAFALASIVTTEAAAQVVIVEERRRRPVYVRRVMRVPPGYHIEERPRTGLIVSGAIMTALGGLFLTGAVVDDDRQGFWRGGDTLLAAGGILFLAVGLPVFITGLTTKREVLVRDRYGFGAPKIGDGSPQFGVGATGLGFTF